MPPKPISSPTLSSPDAAAKIIKLLETLHVKLDSKPQCECNQLRQELMELKKVRGKSAEQPPPPLDTYSAVKMAINDAAAYSEKAKRAVWVGRPEESTPELTLASDQKAIEELCAELNDGSLSQALNDGKIRYHRHPEVKADRKKRILKIVFTDEKTRDQFLSLIRSKRPSTVSRVPGNFVRRDLCPYELQLERKARIDAYALNCKIGGLAYGIRDEKLIKFNGIPRPLPAGYETRPPRGYSDLALLNLTNPAINTSLFLQSNGMNMTLNESNRNPSSDILSTLTPMQSKPTVNTTAKGSGTGAVDRSSSEVIVPIPSIHLSVSSDCISPSSPSFSITSKSLFSDSKHIELFYSNARSIRRKSHLLSFIKSLGYHLILLCETWLTCDDGDAFLLGSQGDYVAFRKDRITNAEISRGGGVAILCSPLLNPFLIASFSSDGIECLVIDIHFPSQSNALSSIRICLIYRSPSCSASSLTSLLSFIDPLISNSFLICGDLNFPSIDWTRLTSPSNNDFFSFVCDYRMTQFVDFKTRGDNILDLVLCNTNIVRNVTPSLPFADHTSISFSLGVPSPPLGDFVPSRLYHLADWESISSLISSHDWTLALSSLDTEHASIYFINFCNSLLETFVPKSSRSPFSHYPKHLRILYGKSQRASSLASNSMQAASLAKRFERALRVHSERVESRVIDSKNPKAFYSLCKTRLSSSKSAPPGIIDLNGSLLLTNKDKALAFSKYFASVSTLPMHAPLRPSVPSPTIPLFDLPSISPAQILAGIASLAPKCNFSPDCLPNIFYAKCKFSIVSPLLIIFNKSLHSKSIPSLWKQAIVKPIPKTSSNAISTFRPISLTCSVTKIFEKILISEITSYLERHNLFDFNQAGFRSGTCPSTRRNALWYTMGKINGTPLSVSPSIKDLGVLMQSSLKFNDHISRIVSKARAKVNLIFKCFFSTEPGLYSRAFSTFVRPLLEYGSVVWSPHTVTLANHIEGVQRNFSKRLFIRCRIPYSLYPDRIAQLSLPTLEHRRLISDILFLHKSIHGFYSYDRTNLFKLSPLARSLRRSHSLRIVLPYSLPKSHSNFVTRAIDRWNVLSAEFVHSSPSNFRSHILSLPSISFTSDSLLRL
ncbi:hypothetical protein PRIPAC_77129 [Pristionchus pacificus]|uniref:Endo/exonuclease/phosphatase domain-containing protein n=1 Tax=Pristionchus pacificus TaxID=54126 RepID=A0A2A6CJQ1_PRIPA|nr:hypothetical protein PRIPAC_77129 [Pristionchus pacificus]|eukprot:PDM78340.1 hypothetical protein PRIPAC_30919 [Pristionchus pacificus]